MNPTADPAIDLHLHGYPAVRIAGRRAPIALKRGLALLARLAEARGRLSRTSVGALLWPDAGTALARTRLRRLVHELNRRIGVELVAGDTDTMWLSPGPARLCCDWLEVQQAALGVLAGDPAVDAEPLLRRDAHRLLDGFVLDSDTFDDWLDAVRREHAALLARALQRLARRWMQAGQPACAVLAAERLVQLDPCAEAGYAGLVAARAQLGDAAGVETAYFACAEALRQEFGVRPSPAFERAYADAVAQCARAGADSQLDDLLEHLAWARPAGTLSIHPKQRDHAETDCAPSRPSAPHLCS